MSPLFAFGIGPLEIAIVAVLGILLFGNKLPGIGRSLGQTLVEFKKGVKGVEEDLDTPSPTAQKTPAAPPRVTAPKFDSP